MGRLLTPKYVTERTALLATEMALNAVTPHNTVGRMFKGKDCHVVVLVPSTEDVREEDYPLWPNYPVQPYCIHQHSVGDKSEWKAPFDEIARCKALQLWRGQNEDGNTDSMPHLLFPDDTPFWGGVKRHGIVVACSGFQPYFDQLVSGIVADGIKALARHDFETSGDKGKPFLK